MSSSSSTDSAAPATVGDILILVNSLDTLWLLLGAILVFFMQVGFSMLEVGSVSVRNTKNILMKNVGDAAMGSLVWWWLGYGLAFGRDKGQFIGSSNFGLVGSDFIRSPVDDSLIYGDNKYISYGYAFWFFQWAFAATAATIVSGAVAERTTFNAYIIYSMAITGFIYPVIVHWVWDTQGWASSWRSDGLLFGCGAVDFAGSGVVHSVGGLASLCAAVIVGPRIGRFNPDGSSNSLPQQSAVFQTLGVLLLWFGWYGFNGASSLYIATERAAVTAAKAMVMTTIGAASGGVSATIVGKFTLGHWDHGMSNNGLLAGLVAVTAGCSTVEPYGAFIIGTTAGWVYSAVSRLIVKLRIDDVVDAVAVHLGCGLWGVLMVGLFATKENYANAYYADRAGRCCGAFYGGNGHMLGANIVWLIALITWVGGWSTALFIVLDKTVGMRCSQEEEEIGMDDSKHGGQTYPEQRTSITNKAAIGGGNDESKSELRKEGGTQV